MKIPVYFRDPAPETLERIISMTHLRITSITVLFIDNLHVTSPYRGSQEITRVED